MNVDFFIERFSKIPEEKWTTYRRIDVDGARCAYGWCYDSEEEANQSNYSPKGNEMEEFLSNLFIDRFGCEASDINNRKTLGFTQDTPKERVLAALEKIKNGY